MSKWDTIIRKVNLGYADEHEVVWEGKLELVQALGVKVRAGNSTYVISDIFIEIQEDGRKSPKQVLFVVAK